VAERLNAAALKAVDPVLRIRGFESHPLRSLPFVYRHRVRYHECDAQGIVFNANWFTYFDVTLTEWFRDAFGSYDALVQAGCDVVLAETGARFRASARFDDAVDVEVGIERLGTTSMVALFTARRDGGALVEGRTVYVFVDPATMAKQPIPDWVRERLEPYVVGAPR
jgi:acyl-CoA thioester hydrolase